MKKIAIFCSEYQDNSGGIIVMHYLCHLLRGLGVEAYMFPRFGSYFINFALNNDKKYWEYLGNNFIKSIEIFKQKKYKTNPNFDTPVMFETPPDGFNENWIVIYPENTLGNPLSAKNIVRWLLASPFEHSEIFSVNKGEFLIKHGVIGTINISGVLTSEMELSIQYNMQDEYYQIDPNNQRSGIAYCIRKGKNKKIIHNLNDSICIDGLGHSEISKIFNRIKTFISYDTATFFSQYAVLCGADSVVIPDNSFNKEQWRSLPNKQGIAYGFDEIEWAKETKKLLLDYYNQINSQNSIQCKKFIESINEYFH
jgi:hypothetical protein